MTWHERIPEQGASAEVSRMLWPCFSSSARPSLAVMQLLQLAARLDSDMFLLAVELGDALNRHIVGLGCTRGKKNLLRVGSDETGDL